MTSFGNIGNIGSYQSQIAGLTSAAAGATTQMNGAQQAADMQLGLSSQLSDIISGMMTREGKISADNKTAMGGN